MAILNITYNGLSADYRMALDFHTTDYDIRRIAVEVIRSGGIRGLHIANLNSDCFKNYVVDRLTSPTGEQRIYLRPKVPFGSEVLGNTVPFGSKSLLGCNRVEASVGE